jgi:hypothetical protein
MLLNWQIQETYSVHGQREVIHPDSIDLMQTSFIPRPESPKGNWIYAGLGLLTSLTIMIAIYVAFQGRCLGQKKPLKKKRVSIYEKQDKFFYFNKNDSETPYQRLS